MTDPTPEALPLVKALASRGIDRGVMVELGEGLAGATASTSTTYDVVSGGAIYLRFDPRWSPTTDDDTRHETLSYVWATYWDDMASTLSAGLDFAALADCVGDWSVSTELGDFWNEGSGPSGKVVLHALRLIATYLQNIGNSAEHCPGARDAMGALLFRSDWIDVDRWSKLDDDESTVQIRNGLPPNFLGSSAARTGMTNWWTRQCHLGANFVDELGVAIDRLLWPAHRAYQAPLDHSTRSWRLGGGMAGSVYYWSQARSLGSLALGGVTEIANSIIHEAMHSDVAWAHCSNTCCQERVAAKWQCRTMAETGALRCAYSEKRESDDLDAVDLPLGGVVFGGSKCHGKSSFEELCAKDAASEEGKSFCWECELGYPGVASSADDWSKSFPWVSPAGCP